MLKQEKRLWHGTSTTHPDKIYKDTQDGFRLALSGDTNMWGKGLYFAVDTCGPDRPNYTVL